MMAGGALSAGSGWKAELELGFSTQRNRTVMHRVSHSGPLRVQRPFYPEGEVCHVYMLHPPGGVVGGDHLDIAVTAGPGARVLLTTPGSTKFYQSAGDWALFEQRLSILEGGSLEWFPQENILFPGAKLQAKTDVLLSGDAIFMGWDIICLGRPSNQERFETGLLDAGLNIYRDGQPVLLERQRVLSAESLDAAAGMRGFPMLAVLMATPCDESHLQQVQVLLEAMKDDGGAIGVTLLDGLLVVRALGWQTEQLQKKLIPVWQELRQPLLQRPAVMPRIWAT
jgi:urease accessory protein